MKTTTLLFFGAFAAMIAVDFLFSFLPKAEFKAKGEEHPYVQQVLEKLNNPIDATTSPFEERRFSVGYIMRAQVMPGIRLIHDPSLGKEIIAKGPSAALDLLSFEAKEGRLAPDFTKTVTLKELVEVRVNLEAHGSERMRVNLHKYPRRKTLNAEFTTSGPLKFRFLELINAGGDRIEVNVENLVMWSHNSTENVFGTAGRLEILNSDGTGASTMVPNLKAGELIRTEITESVEGPEKPLDTVLIKDAVSSDSLTVIPQ